MNQNSTSRQGGMISFNMVWSPVVVLLLLLLNPTEFSIVPQAYAVEGGSLRATSSSSSSGQEERQLQGRRGSGTRIHQLIPSILVVNIGPADETDTNPAPAVELDGQEGSANAVPFFRSSSGVFNATLPLFSKTMATPYPNASILVQDLTEVLKMYASSVIKTNSAYSAVPPLYTISQSPPEATFTAVSEAGTAQAAPPSPEGLTDFSTNNQEEGVDEADFTKSDGTYVYTVYGDTIVVWEALTGTLVTNLTLPVVSEGGSGGGNGNFIGLPRPQVVDNIFDEPFHYPPVKPNIEGLLLSSSRLVAIVSGYSNSGESERTTLYGANATRILVYSTESLGTTGELVQLHQKDLNGNYRDARTIGDSVHLVTATGLDVYSGIAGPLERWRVNFVDLDDEAYIEQARTLAETELIPAFVAQFVADISFEGQLPTLARVGLWQSILPNETSVEDFIYANRPVVDTYLQVSSFNITDSVEDGLGISISGALTPSSWGHTYTTPDMLIFASRAWNWVGELGGSVDTTYLMGFALNGTSSTPAAVGSVPGYINDPLALDIHDGHLRIATTIENMAVTPLPQVSLNDTSFVRPVWRAVTENQVIVLKIPTLGADGEPGEFEEVGRIPNLGKEFEVITTVRYFDNVAYAVTFQRTDPFYVLNLTDPTNPGVLGELNVTGFSSYLHSINTDNTMLVAVGQEADEEGFIVGLQLTLFNATDPHNPQVVHRYTIEQDPDTFSSSTVEWDHKAFRYLRIAEEVGIVILPTYITNWATPSDNFDGFLAFDVRNGTISQRVSISHATGDDFFGCYYDARLAQRSLVFNGTVTTMKGHNVIATDLVTGNRTWLLDLIKPDLIENCHTW